MLTDKQDTLVQKHDVTGEVHVPKSQIGSDELNSINKNSNSGCTLVEDAFWDERNIRHNSTKIEGTEEQKSSLLNAVLSKRSQVSIYTFMMKLLIASTLISRIPGATSQEISPLYSSQQAIGLNQNNSLFNINFILLAATALAYNYLLPSMIKTINILSDQAFKWQDRVTAQTHSSPTTNHSL